MESDTKYFTAGRDTRWECTSQKDCTLTTFGRRCRRWFEVQVQDKGGNFLIAYLDLDESRQFGVFNSLGFQFYQSGGNLKGQLLHKVGREYKSPAQTKFGLTATAI